MKNLKLFIFVVFFYSSAIKAQNIEIGVAPLAYILKGFSVVPAVTFEKSRIGLQFITLEMPEAMQGDNKGFKRNLTGIGLTYDYFFKRTGKGFFAGAQFNYVNDKIKYLLTGEEKNNGQYEVGFRGGYQFSFGKEETNYKGLYISPFLVTDIHLNPSNMFFDNNKVEYKRSAVDILPSLTVGWRF